MTEENTLDTTGFDLADWLSGGTAHRATKTVTVYRDANLVEEIERYEKAQKETPEGMESMGETPDPRADEELLARLEKSKAEVKIFALIDTEIKAVKETLGDKPKGFIYESESEYWYQVFERAATLNGHNLTAEQWAKVHETIGAQMGLLIQAYATANRADVTPRFRR